MGYQAYGSPAGGPPMEPVEAQSVRSMLHIARILAIIFGIIFLLIGVADAATVAYYASVCSSLAFDAYCGPIAFLYVGPAVVMLFGVVNFIIYVRLQSIETLVNNRQYEQAKGESLLWMILGFVLAGVLIGIVILLPYLKFDALIQWQRSGGMPPPAYGAPTPYGVPAPAYAAAPTPMVPPANAGPFAAPAPTPVAAPLPAAVVAPMAPSAPTTPCTRCGRPAIWIAQYNRWYCPAEQQYL